MNPIQWISLFLFLAIWWFDLFHMLGIRVNPKHYYNMYYRLIPKPPMWVFGVVNNIVYPLAAVATHQYLNWTTPNRPIYDAALGLLLATLIIEKLWGPVFFRLKWLWGAMLIITCIFLTSAAALIVVWVDTRSNGVSNYVAGGLLIPYVLWTIYRLLLNLDIAYHNGHVSFSYREDIVTGHHGMHHNMMHHPHHSHPNATSHKGAHITVYSSSANSGRQMPNVY